MGDGGQYNERFDDGKCLEDKQHMVRFGNDEKGVVHQDLFHEVREDVVDVHDRREPEPQLHYNSDHLLQIPDEHGERGRQHPQAEGEGLL